MNKALKVQYGSFICGYRLVSRLANEWSNCKDERSITNADRTDRSPFHENYTRAKLT